MTAVACPFCGAEHTAGTYVCPVTNRRLAGLLPVNTVIDAKYRIDGIIGVGGMGVVYRAEHTKIARQVALKMLLPEYIVYPDLVARVEREARTAGQIEHPNVVSIVDLGTTAEHGPYIAMELLRGQELATTVERAGGTLPAPEAVDIMRQVLAGLEAAHKRGVIHRDLKPENIFLSQQEDASRVVKVLDFGISKLRDDTQLSSLTRTGTVMGTPQFMAPEQAAGARDQDVRIDLYAAGAVLYAVLCNGLPYEAENYNLLINEILNKPPIPILSRNSLLDPRLAAIVMKAIAKKPETRFQTARAMADALTHWYDNRNTPIAPQRVHTGAMPAYRASGRSSSDVIQVVSAPARKSHNPRLGPGAQELGRVENGRALANEPQVLARLDESLSPDDPAYVDRDEATIMVPTVLPDDAIREEIPELDADFDDMPSPRTSRPSVTGTSEIAALIESPLDAPPLVLPERRKPPPSDDAWARLRTDHPSAPPVDPLLDDAVVQPQTRVWPYVLLFLLVVCAGAAVAVQRFAPHSWERFKALAGLVHLPLPQRGPTSVRFVEPDAGHVLHTADARVAHTFAVVDAVVPAIADPVVDASLVATDASVARDEAPDAPTPANAAARGARHRRRRHE